MECLNCRGIYLKQKDYKGLYIEQCPECFAVWISKDKLRAFKDKTDEFLCWVKMDLWENLDQHGVTKSNLKCPCCSKYMSNVDYKGSHIVLPVCFSCKGVWMNYSVRMSLFSYLDTIVTSETIAGFLKEIGSETLDFITGKESIKDELRDLKTILILIEYRIFSKFPALEKIISGFPK